MTLRTRRVLPLLVLAALFSGASRLQATAPQPPSDTASVLQADDKKGKGESPAPDTETEITHAMIRLPLAAALGAALALRPKRRGTPPRQPAVIQTQIILGIVGALVMMVVGTNLARAFGVVGAAGLVRYRAKIEDPKDAGVMLSTLGIGLASGVGLYAMAAFSAAFILVALWTLESFEPQSRKVFALTIKMGKDTDRHRKAIEEILRRYHVDFELLSSADDGVAYEALVPLETARDRVTNTILKLDPDGHAAVEWAEKKPKAK
jgi:uncharacterized membrane protein YhiD involved in acid resistance